ncbi:pyocin knob domain-containing protein [Proteus columbae]|uniref:pyocin knob domain-containing protein n=1 Tax=Proteus columbae TaxID=1987580 RepID=UPI003F772016
MTKIFKTPFATQGDKTVVPVEIQSDGSVSYTQGYGYDYERDQVTDPAAKDIEREKMNSLFHDITESIGEMQLQGFAKWSEAGKPYPIRSVVYHKNKAWQSKIENNNVEPIAGNAWIELKADITANEVGAYSKDDADKRFQPLGKYQVEGHSYSKAETDTKYQPKGNYAPAGNYATKGESYTKVESDGKYQPKGSYQPSGDYATKGESYTKAESDSKYQGKGNYQVAGYSYSKSEADNKYQAKGNYVATTRKVNDKPLSGDVTVTSQDIFSNQAISIGANQNLNNYKTAGIYFQPANANATTNLNYPETMAGTLIVLKNAGITQLYYVYNTSRIYSRSQYDKGNFTPWAKEFNSQNKPTAADVGAYSKGESDGKYQPKGNYVPSGRKVNGKTLSADIVLTANDVGAATSAQINEVKTLTTTAQNTANNANTNANNRVPNTRKVNGKQLNSDITLTAGDVGALTQAQADERYLIASSNDVLGIGKYIIAKYKSTNYRVGFGSKLSGSELKTVTFSVDRDNGSLSAPNWGGHNNVGVGTWMSLGEYSVNDCCALFIRVA